MTNPNSRSPRGPHELDDDALDVVIGGGSVGVYGNIGYISPVTTGNVTVALGLQSSFPFVTGGVYTNHGDGFSTGASVGASVGVFGAKDNADSYFTGPGNSGSLGVDALAKVGVEGGFNSSGVSAGVGVGAGVTGFGVDGVGIQAAGMHTEGTSVFESGGATFNANPTGIGVPTSSPQEYAGYFNASQSPPLDRSEPSSPELNAAINAINNDSGAHATDAGHDTTDSHSTDSNATDPPTDHFNGNDFDGHDSGSTQVASNDSGGGGDSGGSDFGGDFGGGDFGGGDFA